MQNEVLRSKYILCSSTCTSVSKLIQLNVNNMKHFKRTLLRHFSGECVNDVFSGMLNFRLALLCSISTLHCC